MQKGKLRSHEDHDNTFCSIRMHHNLPFLMEKTAKNGHFLVRKCFFLKSDKQWKTAPLF